MDLEAADAQPPSQRINLHLLLPRHSTGDQRARRDSAESLDRKSAVHGQAEMPGGVLLRRSRRRTLQCGAQFGKSVPRYGAYGNHGRSLQE